MTPVAWLRYKFRSVYALGERIHKIKPSNGRHKTEKAEIASSRDASPSDVNVQGEEVATRAPTVFFCLAEEMNCGSRH